MVRKSFTWIFFSVKFQDSSQERKVLTFHSSEVDRATILFLMILICGTGRTTFVVDNTFKTGRIKIYIFNCFISEG